MADSDDGGASRTVRRHGALSFGTITGALNAIGTVWIFVLMALISTDVIGRGAFNAPLSGVPEMVQFSIVGIVFLQLAHTLRNGALTRSDVILRGLLVNFPAVGHALQMLFHAAGARGLLRHLPHHHPAHGPRLSRTAISTARPACSSSSSGP